MISVAEARARVLEGLAPLPAEMVALPDALGRVLAEPVAARITSPAAATSAMDGYGVRAADVAKVPAILRQIGAVPAGQVFSGTVGPGECVRIFTGAPLPAGADTIVIQENTEAEGDRVTVRETAALGRYVRPQGLDFAAGQVLLEAGRRLNARAVALAAAMNVPWLAVRRRPRVAILATGDEVVLPGEPIGPSQLPSSNSPGLAAMVTALGGQPVMLPTAADDVDALRHLAAGAVGCDLLVTTGGASVGEHDLVRDALVPAGLDLGFWSIAMRPGKPLMHGRIGGVPMLGLPGNPVSTMICGLLFLRPVLRALQGLPDDGDRRESVRLGRDLPANDRREEYMRARLDRGVDGVLVATPFAAQDSAMVSLMAAAQCLVVRPPLAPPAAAGDAVTIVRFEDETLPL
ncbi:MAG: molybdopterin molybdotransferase MoeA [Rhodospirillaceae bacterium]|nr:molybdopterin molybdotransferase MoeA [Rhodospirillaceae bacterium]